MSKRSETAKNFLKKLVSPGLGDGDKLESVERRGNLPEGRQW
jgi:hypothetical protein